MFQKHRKSILWLMLLLSLLLLCSCKENPSEEVLKARLIGHFEARGYTCSFEAAPLERSVPIYNASAWEVMHLGQEEVLVYFDESNRADYLADGIDPAGYTFVGQLGLRYVLAYEGQDEDVLEALRAMPEV